MEFGEFSGVEEVGVVEVGELVEVDLVETFGGLEGLMGRGVGEGLLELQFFGKKIKIQKVQRNMLFLDFVLNYQK